MQVPLPSMVADIQEQAQTMPQVRISPYLIGARLCVVALPLVVLSVHTG